MSVAWIRKHISRLLEKLFGSKRSDGSSTLFVYLQVRNSCCSYDSKHDHKHPSNHRVRNGCDNSADFSRNPNQYQEESTQKNHRPAAHLSDQNISFVVELTDYVVVLHLQSNYCLGKYVCLLSMLPPAPFFSSSNQPEAPTCMSLVLLKVSPCYQLASARFTVLL